MELLDFIPWPFNPSFVGGELSVFWNWAQVWVWVCQIFLESQQSQNWCFWSQMCVLASRLDLKWSQDKSICEVFTCFVCVLIKWSDWECNVLFSARSGTTNWVFWCCQVEKVVWCKLFVKLVYTSTLPIHPSTWLRDLWFKVENETLIHL